MLNDYIQIIIHSFSDWDFSRLSKKSYVKLLFGNKAGSPAFT